LKYISVTESNTLIFKNKDIPSIDNDECLIKVKAIGVNRADILQRDGKYPPPKGESTILGIEVSGEIVGCGVKVNAKWNIGDRVCGLVAGGGYAEYVKINAQHLILLPSSYSFGQGAALAETYLTAYQSLFLLANLKPHQNVLIHAGASGVGTAAIQLAKASECYVAVTVGSAKKQQACLDLGADEAINYHEQDFRNLFKESKSSFDVIIDVVGGNYVNKNIDVASVDGQIVILSILKGRFTDNIDIAKLLLKRLTLHASTLRNRSIEYKSNLTQRFVDDFYLMLESNKIIPVVDKYFQWFDTELAHQYIIENKNIGKIVLTIPED